MTIKKALIYYFGLLQVPHLVLNFFILFVPSILTGGDLYLGKVVEVLFLNSVLDFIITSPLGILFLYSYVKKQKSASRLGLIALTSAFANAVLYIYLLVSNNLFSVNASNVVILILFSPPVILFFLTIWNLIKGKDYLSPS